MSMSEQSGRQIDELQQVVSDLHRSIGAMRILLVILTLVVVAGFGYVAAHAVEYRDCVAQPSLVTWPGSCL